MVQNNEIFVESLPLSESGMPQVVHKPGKPGKVKVIDEDGTRIVERIIPDFEKEFKLVKLQSANVGRLVEIFPGSKFKIILGRASNGQECPIIYCLGLVVLESNKEYELVYEDIPIEGWTVRDCSKLAQDPNAETLCYPKGIKTQKLLIDTILRHESIYNCPFAYWSLEHPPEIQDQLDMRQLEVRETALEEKRKAMQEAFKKQEAKLASDKKRILDAKEAKLKG
jgi:hypothetical protein